MRFLFLTQYFPPEVGAPQVRLASMIRELVRLGHDVEVVTALPNYPTGRISAEYRGKFYAREHWEDIPVHRVWLYAATGAGLKRILNYASFTAMSLVGLLRARRPDYLFVESPPLFLGVPAFMATSRWRVPIIFNVADLWPDTVRELGLMREGPVLRFAERLEAWSYRKATYVNAVTEGIRRRLIDQKKVPSSKVLFLPNGVDTHFFQPRDPNVELARELGLEGKNVVLYAGTHGYVHGLGVALHSAKLLLDSRIVIVLIGDGSEKSRLTSISRDMGLDNVLFLDPASPEYIAELYGISLAGLSTLIASPLSESIRPAKIFATMASGKPVLYSGAGEGGRLVEEARAGIVVPPENPEALADAIRTLVNDPSFAEELGRNGRRYVEQHLNWPILVQNWLTQLTSARCPDA